MVGLVLVAFKFSEAEDVGSHVVAAIVVFLRLLGFDITSRLLSTILEERY